MRDCCPANQFDDGCEDGVCKSKATDLGRFTKPVPKPHDTRGWQYGLVGLFAALCLWWGITEGYPEHRKMELATQESR